MPIHYAEDAAPGTAILTLRGPLGWADYAALCAPLTALRDRCGPLRVIEVIESFAGFEDGLGERIETACDRGEAQALLAAISHVAIVSDIGWFCPVLSVSLSRGFALRSFALADLDSARAWMLSAGAPPNAGPAARMGRA
ncbi:STAS/SEC14 domain-containing protein [Ponticoccus litoralis]|uniref:STAS/SEC14 domain-containing protein n=1 Tax=Ponticoccus litoralis TaxID=422297 RepID=A0AAW9SPW9_9RHOB